MNPRLVLAAALLLLPATSHCGEADEAPASSATEGDEQDLVQEPSLILGTWKSPVCERVDSETYLLRTYQIATNGIFAEWAHHGSPTCSSDSILFKSRQRGGSAIEGHSPVATLAARIRVDIKEKSIEPRSPEGLARLKAACPQTPWALGVEQDVTATGCAEYVSTCKSEFDVMTIRGKKLTFGDRSAPMCTEATRPTKMSPWSISFVAPF